MLAGGLGGCAWFQVMRDQVEGVAAPLPGESPVPGTPAVEESDKRLRLSKSGPEVKAIISDEYDGLLYGARSVRYVVFAPSAYYGVMGYSSLPGEIGDEIAPLFGYIGVLGGYEGTLLGWPSFGGELPAWTGYAGRRPPLLAYDLNLHVGLTRDLSDFRQRPLGNHFSLEPSLSLSVPLPVFKGTRLALSGGYLLLPLAPEYSGWTFGLRVDMKAFEVRHPVE